MKAQLVRLAKGTPASFSEKTGVRWKTAWLLPSCGKRAAPAPRREQAKRRALVESGRH
jgi:hypothetical protein